MDGRDQARSVGTPGPGVDFSFFGGSVAVDGNTIAAGAFAGAGTGESLFWEGAAYLFRSS